GQEEQERQRGGGAQPQRVEVRVVRVGEEGAQRAGEEQGSQGRREERALAFVAPFHARPSARGSAWPYRRLRGARRGDDERDGDDDERGGGKERGRGRLADREAQRDGDDGVHEGVRRDDLGARDLEQPHV